MATKQELLQRRKQLLQQKQELLKSNALSTVGKKVTPPVERRLPKKTTNINANTGLSNPRGEIGAFESFSGALQNRLAEGGVDLLAGGARLAGQVSRLARGDQSQNPDLFEQAVRQRAERGEQRIKAEGAAPREGEGIAAKIGSGIGIVGRNAPAFVGSAAAGTKAFNAVRGGGMIKNIFQGATAGAVGTQAFSGIREAQPASVGETIAGAAIGGAIPTLGAAKNKFVSWWKQAQKNMAGVAPDLEKRITNMPAKKIQSYALAAQKRSGSVDETSAVGKAGEAVEKAASKITALRQAAGKQVGEAKKAAVDNQIDASGAINRFTQKIGDIFEMTPVRTKPKAKTFKLKPAKGSLRNVDQTEKATLTRFYNQALKVKNGKQAQEVIKNLDEVIEKNKAYDLQFGGRDTPFTSTLKTLRTELNESLISTSDDLAKANAKFSNLLDVEQQLKQQTGGRLQRAELLMRRVFSGDKSREGRGLLDEIKKLTGQDLVEDAVAARWATEQFGSQSSKSLLQQVIGGEVTDKFSFIRNVTDAIGDAVKSKIADPEKVVNSLRSDPQARSQLVESIIQILTPTSTRVGASVASLNNSLTPEQ